MAINAYVGVPGSGKTYEVVKSVILPNFLKGRRIVTNIEGVDEDKFRSYVEKYIANKDKNFDPSSLGQIIKVSDDDVLKEDFFPFKGSDDSTIAKNGDLICIDEVWRIFDEKSKIKENHKSFIAEHRHFVNSNGNTSDLVVINQSVSNIPKFIKDRIESVFKMTKLGFVGLGNRYRIDVYSGSRTYKTALIHSMQEKYDKRIFELYKSYDQDGAVESKIDGRANIFKGGFIFKMLFALIVFISSIFYLFVLLNKVDPKENKVKDDLKPAVLLDKNGDRVEREGDKYFYVDDKKPDSVVNEPKPDILSDRWRIIGTLKKSNGESFVIISDGKYNRYEYLSNFFNEGNLLYGFVDGYKVTTYSGSGTSSFRGLNMGNVDSYLKERSPLK